MRLSALFARIAVALILSSLLAGASYAAVVNVDVAAKTVKSDVATLESKGARVMGDQVGFLIQSTILEPQKIAIKISGLKDEDYDVYVNSSFAGAKPSKLLEQGLELTIPGTLADPDMMRCVNTMKPIVDAEYDRLGKIKEPEVQRVWYTLDQAADWIRSAIRNEKMFRSVAVVVSPAGRALQQMTFPTRLDAQTTAEGITRSCWLLQQARTRMYEVIKDPIIRNNAVATLTPVELRATYSAMKTKPHVNAVLANNCNLPVSGAFTIDAPKGWKTNAKNLAFTSLKPGKSLKLSFDLLRAAKGAAVPATVPISANIKVAQLDQTARLKLTTVAKTYIDMPSLAPPPPSDTWSNPAPGSSGKK